MNTLVFENKSTLTKAKSDKDRVEKVASNTLM